MLLACSECHRQYDVGDHDEGSRVRCLCGTLSTVRKTRARRLEMLHCSNCGGRLAHGEMRCEYCSSEVKLADRGIGPTCPECFATTIAGARHCSACGVRLDPQGVLRALSSHLCPRCQKPLSECASDKVRYVECTACGGLWLDEELFQRVASEREEGLVATFTRGESPPATGLTLESSVRYLPCPVCAQIMNRRNFAQCSGVILDWCRGHGWWFDANELERVMAFIAGGGLEKSRRREHEQRARELDRREQRSGQPVMVPPSPYRGFGMTSSWGMIGQILRLLGGLLSG